MIFNTRCIPTYETIPLSCDHTTEATELHFGPKAPAGKEGQWIKTVPGRGWFAYIRIYGPEQAAFDGTWKPGDIEEVK